MRKKTAAREVMFSAANGVLRAEGDLYWERLGEFETACDRLLASRGDQLVLDLGAASFVASSFLGAIASLALRAARRRKKVDIRLALDTSWLFEIMGGRKMVKLEIV